MVVVSAGAFETVVSERRGDVLDVYTVGEYHPYTRI
jgi:hypothetical protein